MPARGADGGRSGAQHREMRALPRSGTTRAGTVDVWVLVIVSVNWQKSVGRIFDRGTRWVASPAMHSRSSSKDEASGSTPAGREDRANGCAVSDADGPSNGLRFGLGRGW